MLWLAHDGLQNVLDWAPLYFICHCGQRAENIICGAALFETVPAFCDCGILCMAYFPFALYRRLIEIHGVWLFVTNMLLIFLISYFQYICFDLQQQQQSQISEAAKTDPKNTVTTALSPSSNLTSTQNTKRGQEPAQNNLPIDAPLSNQVVPHRAIHKNHGYQYQYANGMQQQQQVGLSQDLSGISV